MGFFGDIFRLWRSNRKYENSQLNCEITESDRYIYRNLGNLHNIRKSDEL